MSSPAAVAGPDAQGGRRRRHPTPRTDPRRRNPAPTIISIVAPAGHGKTSLLAAWARRDPRPSACVTLDAARLDPIRLLALIGAALSTVMPPPSEGQVAAAFALFVDVVGDEGSPQSSHILEVLFSSVPHGSTVAVASRYPLPAIARIRAEHEVHDLGPTELRAELAHSLLYDTGIGESLDQVVVTLTSAESRLLPYLRTHLTAAQIGERLFISRNTVTSQLASIYRKLGVHSRSAAVDACVRLGMLED